MPLARIDISNNATPELAQLVSDVVYAAMIEIANVPPHDKFQIITRHAAGQLIYPSEGYLGIDYTPGIIFIQVFWVAGRTTDIKKAFYRKIADDLHARAGVRRQDVFINLIDSAREDWSFGNGEMQYAPA
jgi:4-oxalocrotonate tautomerase